MSKQDIVNKWWETRLGAGVQISDPKAARDQGWLAESFPQDQWLKRVDTDALYWDHVEWAYNNEYDEYAGTLSKPGFMLMFYKISGAWRTRTRFGLRGNKAKYVASFNELDFHREFYRAERSAA